MLSTLDDTAGSGDTRSRNATAAPAAFSDATWLRGWSAPLEIAMPPAAPPALAVGSTKATAGLAKNGGVARAITPEMAMLERSDL